MTEEKNLTYVGRYADVFKYTFIDSKSNSLIKLWTKYTFEGTTRCKLHTFREDQTNKKDIKSIFLQRTKCLEAFWPFSSSKRDNYLP